MSRERMLKPLTWDQVVFLWDAGNKNFYHTYDEGSEASVGLDEWEYVVKHFDNKDGFAIEEDEILKWDCPENFISLQLRLPLMVIILIRLNMIYTFLRIRNEYTYAMNKIRRNGTWNL